MTATLKLDIDGKIDWERLRMVVNGFSLNIDFDKSKIARTRHGYHVYLSVNDKLKSEDMCFLQLLGGSDCRREMFNWNRIRHGIGWERKYWNVLFKQKFHVDTKGNKKLVSEEKEMSNNILRRMLE
jgi:hypothetical protein